MSNIAGITETLILWIKLCVEILAAIIVGTGILSTVIYWLRLLCVRDVKSFYKARLRLSHFLLVALEFQLAADILGTAAAPGWGQLGRLGAVAVIRTFLSYFLTREIKEGRDE